MRMAISVSVLALLLTLSGAAGATLYAISVSNADSSESFSIEAPVTSGINEYNLVEVDEGDNDEEDVITERLHVFKFTALSTDGVVTWDFGDGMVAVGSQVEHEYALPGLYLVTATSATPESIVTDTVSITVLFEGNVESDNMECVCAPTAKATIVDLVAQEGVASYEGIVTVEHEGSSESCALRNPLQECHIRVILERTLDGSVIEQDVLFDDTFRTNEYSVVFEMLETTVSDGESLQLRLETDQLRDWHKPTTQWSMTAPE